MKKKILAGVFFSVGALVSMFAQIKADNYRQWMAKAQKLYDLESPTTQTDSLTLLYFERAIQGAMQERDYASAASCLIKCGNVHQTYQRYSLSNQNYHHALFLWQKNNVDKRIAYEAYLYMGSSHYFSNTIDSAQYYFEEASSIAAAYKQNQLPEEEILYNSLGAIYFESANYQQASNYFEKALKAIPIKSTTYEQSYIGIRSNIANCLLRLNSLQSALDIYHELQGREKIPKDVHEIINQNTAHTYFQIGKYDSALILYRKLRFDNALNRTKALNDMGRIFMQRGEFLQSERTFDSAIAVNKRISASIKNKEEALAYLYRGQLAARQGLIDEALTWCNEALHEIHIKFNWTSTMDLPVDITQSVSPIALFEILRTKGNLLFKKFQQVKQPSYLEASVKTFRKAIETANFIKRNFDNDEAKFFFNDNYRLIYNEAIEAAYELQHKNKTGLNDYLFVLENYKGTVLHQNLQENWLKSNAKVPDSIKRREREIRQLLSFYTTRINNNGTEKDAEIFQNRLLELQVELSRLQKKYENDESYLLFRYHSNWADISLKQIQEKIDQKTALLNYYQTDSAIYLLAITKRAVQLEKILTTEAFHKQTELFLKELNQHIEGRRYEGLSLSDSLYKKLILPVGSLVSSCQKWVVIPDRLLYHIPIEALRMDDQNNRYVVEEKEVSYHYSLALLFNKDNPLNNKNDNRNIAAFAPYASNDPNIRNLNLPFLPYSSDEVKQSNGSWFISERATKKKFLEVAPQQALIHLATHASSGTDTSTNWIQFYPSDTNNINNRLFLHEIYDLDLHKVRLVLLSACETANGQIVTGEGLISLSRAFIYAGCDGIISTLWKTEDQVTAFLMQRFHYYRKQNASSESALRKAKIDLLNNRNIGAQFKTPNYWGNFIYVGKISSTEENNAFAWPWPLLIILFFLLTLFGLYKKKRFRNPSEPST